jgi:uncharacterized Zn-finger protein
MITTIPKHKHGDCSRCPKKDTAGKKRGKDFVCLACCNEEDRQKQIDKAKKRNALRGVATKLKSLPQNKEMVAKLESKSQMLILADGLFSKAIRQRDADKNGNIQCPGCKKVYNVEQINADGDKIVQCLHFIDRDVYSLRYDEDNAHAGCSYCNLDMHLNKNGFAYRNYYNFMIEKYGEEAVAEMTLAHRKINKLELTQLKNIIEHYGA